MFYVPSKQILTPELLIPGKKPVQRVVVDYSHPLSKYIIFAYLPQQTPFDTASGHILEEAGALSNNNILDHDSYGAYRTGDTQDPRVVQGIPVLGTDDFLIIAGAEDDGTSSGSLCGVGDVGAGQWMFNFSAYFRFYGDSGSINCNAGSQTNNKYLIPSFSRVGTTVRGICYDPSTGSFTSAGTSDTSAGADLNDTTHPFTINGADCTLSSRDSSRSHLGKNWFLIVFKGWGSLDNAVVTSIAENPYQFFKPVGPDYFIIGTAAAGVTKPALLLINGQWKQYGAESPNYPLCINADGSIQAYSDVSGKDPLVHDTGDIRVLAGDETLGR